MSAINARIPRTVSLLTACLAFVLLLAGVASAAPGDVDATFGSGGSITVPVGGSATVAGLVRRGDGSFIVADSVGASLMTVAITNGGILLASYGSGGISSVPIPGSSSVSATDVALQSNGRVLVVGWENAASGNDRFIVARFRAGGAPDDSFSGDGVALVHFKQGDAFSYGLVIQPDGKIVVVGEVDPSSGVSNPAAIRLRPDGTLDPTFGKGGKRIVKVPDGVSKYDGVWRVVVQAHGKLAMAGWDQRRKNSNYKTLVIRLKASGGLDTSFGNGGFVILDADGVDNWSYALAKDGKKLVLGLTTSAAAAGFGRLLGDGHRDGTFGGDGVAIHMLSVSWRVSDVSVLGDHRIVATSDFLGGPNVAQVKAGGKMDTGFGTGGEATGPLVNAEGLGLVMANGKIVVAGTQGADVIAARFLGP
jgi:uncharacterized delta-60 repeat protein